MNEHASISELDHKLDIIDHVNQDHSEELQAIVKHYGRKQSSVINATEPLLNIHDTLHAVNVEDIEDDALLLRVHQSTDSPTQLLRIPFEIEGSLEDKILYLAYAAITKQGHHFKNNVKRFFEVIDTQQLTANITRITIHSASPLPDDYPGYAYAFLLKTISKRPEYRQSTPQPTATPWHKRLVDRIFIWLMKHLSSSKRETLMMSVNKSVRLYTLRQAWQGENAHYRNLGYIDIFTHGQTAGSLWAKQLNAGDIIMSRSETADRHPHLRSGQALLIADETAFPALAGLLEQWHNPQPPHVILLSTHAEDQHYFNDAMWPTHSQIQRIVCPPERQGQEVLQRLANIETIEVVWAALESESAKQVRHYLRNQRHLAPRCNHVKGYWRLKS